MQFFLGTGEGRQALRYGSQRPGIQLRIFAKKIVHCNIFISYFLAASEFSSPLDRQRRSLWNTSD
jgi:hypothetical protein